jgi:SAM-dependent methyltransferase
MIGRGSIARTEAWQHEAVVSPETTRPAQMAKIFGYLKGMHATYLLDLGVRLRLFQRLGEAPGGLHAADLTAACGMDAGYTRCWCETACALELLDYDPEAGYRLAPFMDELLARPEATFSLAGFPTAHLMFSRDYARYPELFRSGGVQPYAEHDEAFLTAVAGATATLPRMFCEAVLPGLPDLKARLETGAAVLDVGCGAGHALVTLAERFPKARCVGIDVEPVSIGLADKLISERGLDDRVQARLLEADSDWPADLAGAFDLVTTFLVLHEIHPDHKAAVLARCAQALTPDGVLLLFDERYPSGPGELRDLTQIFAVMAQWYETTWGNVLNTREEIAKLLAGAGLTAVQETALSRFYIVVAKPTALVAHPVSAERRTGEARGHTATISVPPGPRTSTLLHKHWLGAGLAAVA